MVEMDTLNVRDAFLPVYVQLSGIILPVLYILSDNSFSYYIFQLNYFIPFILLECLPLRLSAQTVPASQGAWQRLR